MPSVKHTNNGNCAECAELFDAYRGFFEPLRAWFEAFQKAHPEAHISCAGRGRQQQEDAYNHKLSRAQYGESAHNWNIAIDLFVNYAADIYDKTWFNTVLKNALTPDIEWYGEPGAQFWELPHCEWRSWRDLRDQGLIELVEPMPKPDDDDY